MTHETLLFLRDLCTKITFQSADPNWREAAMTLMRAQDELDAAIEEMSCQQHSWTPSTESGPN